MPTLVAASESISGTERKNSRGDHAFERQRQRDERAGDRSGARAAVGLDHVAIEPHGALAERFQIRHRAQRAADHPLNFERAAGLLAAARFARRALSVERGSMPYSPVTQPLPLPFRNCGNAVFHGGGDDHARVARFDQHAAFGAGDEVRRDLHRPQVRRRRVRQIAPSLLRSIPSVITLCVE